MKRVILEREYLWVVSKGWMGYQANLSASNQSQRLPPSVSLSMETQTHTFTSVFHFCFMNSLHYQWKQTHTIPYHMIPYHNMTYQGCQVFHYLWKHKHMPSQVCFSSVSWILFTINGNTDTYFHIGTSLLFHELNTCCNTNKSASVPVSLSAEYTQVLTTLFLFLHNYWCHYHLLLPSKWY